MYDDITAIILAGGQSKRMGQNKAFMLFNGETIIERIVKLMKSNFNRVILVTNTPSDFAFLNLETFTDFYANMGPLAGIHSGLVNSKTEKNFIISCDIPLVTSEIIDYICNYNTDEPITIIKANGFLQHLCGMYDRKILPYAADMLMKSACSDESKGCNIHSLTDEMGVEIINALEIPGYFEGMFLNLNRPEDYKELLETIK